MNESTPPPIPQQVKRPPLPNDKFWWVVWIVSTVVIPAASFRFLVELPGGGQTTLVVIGLLVFIPHFVASLMLGRRTSVWTGVGLVIGGWFLMLSSVFAGCLLLTTLGQ